jgi:hypothetical protein
MTTPEQDLLQLLDELNVPWVEAWKKAVRKRKSKEKHPIPLLSVKETELGFLHEKPLSVRAHKTRR